MRSPIDVAKVKIFDFGAPIVIFGEIFENFWSVLELPTVKQPPGPAQSTQKTPPNRAMRSPIDLAKVDCFAFFSK